MSIKCLMNGLEVNYPCSPVCSLFGDCITAFEAQKKENVCTNADCIRAMSDEDLAKWIDWLFGRCEWCDIDKIATDDCNDVECVPCILKWLQQPAEEE